MTGVFHHPPHDYSHDHGYAPPDPAHTPGWSILRTTLAVRLGGVVAISAGLWAIVLLVMR